MKNKQYTPEEVKKGEEFARLISGFGGKDQKVILIAADAFMAGLAAGKAAKGEPEQELLVRKI